jgi:hypothetical protein
MASLSAPVIRGINRPFAVVLNSRIDDASGVMAVLLIPTD